MDIKFELLETPANKGPCRGGVFYRAEVSAYANSRGDFVETYKLRNLKRMSCECSECCYIDELLHEWVKENGQLPFDVSDLEHQKIYRVDVSWFKDVGYDGTEWDHEFNIKENTEL